MSPGEIAGLIVGLLFSVLFSIISWLLKKRFDSQDEEIAELGKQVDANTLALARLTEAQKAVVANQTVISRSQEKLMSESEDLEDVTDQLDTATKRLREKMEQHQRFLLTLGFQEE